MKTLQNNFTTPEQSKRLLELGVPENSADCYYHYYFTNDQTPFLRVLQLQWNETIGAIRGKTGQKIEPCWSVGQLIKILKVCVTDRNELHEIFEELEMCIDETAILVQTFKEYGNVIDFSKLEE